MGGGGVWGRGPLGTRRRAGRCTERPAGRRWRRRGSIAKPTRASSRPLLTVSGSVVLLLAGFDADDGAWLVTRAGVALGGHEVGDLPVVAVRSPGFQPVEGGADQLVEVGAGGGAGGRIGAELVDGAGAAPVGDGAGHQENDRHRLSLRSAKFKHLRL